jgi:aminoglycoside 3-N-acetyltransferase
MKNRAKKSVMRLMRPLLRPWTSQGNLAADLQRLGVKSGACLLVHSSLSSLGFVRRGGHAVIAALEQAIGPTGTLVLPTHTWRWVNQNCRLFDVRNSPSCVGSLSEAFRKLPGVVRSLHPTHSVAARGANATRLTRDHHLAATPCGIGTPYARLIEDDGQILLLGVGLNRNTAFHTVEALANLEYLTEPVKERFTILDFDRRIEIDVRRHKNGVPRRFGDMKPWLVKHGALQEGKVGSANSILIAGLAFKDCMLSLLEQNPGSLMRVIHSDSVDQCILNGA